MARFSCAIWRPIHANTGGALAPIGAVMHQQVGNGSLYGFFSDAANEVSAHFWVPKAGGIPEQYVDTNTVAWHGRDLNGWYVGIEFEGFPEEPLTSAQIHGGAAIMLEGHERHGWPLKLAEASPQSGLGYHRMPGGVNTACPSQLRVDQRAVILEVAGGTAPPDTLKEGETMTSLLIGGQLHVWGVIGNKAFHWWQEVGPPAGPWHTEELPS